MENYKENIKIGDVVYMIMTSCTAGETGDVPGTQHVPDAPPTDTTSTQMYYVHMKKLNMQKPILEKQFFSCEQMRNSKCTDAA